MVAADGACLPWQMTTWNPGDGDPDVLSSGDEEPPWAARVRTVAVSVVCLALGVVLALQWDDEVATRRAVASSAVLLRAGNMEDVIPCRRRCLRLPLFNGGHRPVEVTAVGFDEWRVRANVRREVLQPGTWGNVRFGLGDCAAPEPLRYRYVHVQTSVAGNPRVRTLRMPSATPLVQEEHVRTCPVGRPVMPQELRGVWLLEASHGLWHSFAGALLMRFGADGSFAWDSEGHALDGARAAAGSYQLEGRMLTVMVHNLNACHTGDVFRWRVTMTAPDQLHLQSVHDTSSACSAPDHEVWVVRRIPVDHRLPENVAIR